MARKQPCSMLAKIFLRRRDARHQLVPVAAKVQPSLLRGQSDDIGVCFTTEERKGAISDDRSQAATAAAAAPYAYTLNETQSPTRIDSSRSTTRPRRAV